MLIHVQPALLRHAGYGESKMTTRRACRQCSNIRVVSVESLAPEPTDD